MRWSQVRGRLLPNSGVGVVGPWLVIGPGGSPTIRFDLRVLDRVEIGPEPDEVVIACGECDVALKIADGPEAAGGIVEAIAGVLRGLVAPMDIDPPADATDDGALVVTSSTDAGVPTPGDLLAGNAYVLARTPMTIGRKADNDIVIEHRSISGHHALVSRAPATRRYSIADLHASNGVRVNGVDHPKVELVDGDCVDLGHVRMRFDDADGPVLWTDEPTELDEILRVGRDRVLVRSDRVDIGEISFSIAELAERAERGENLVLAHGRELQAAFAQLVVAVRSS